MTDHDGGLALLEVWHYWRFDTIDSDSSRAQSRYASTLSQDKSRSMRGFERAKIRGCDLGKSIATAPATASELLKRSTRS